MLSWAESLAAAQGRLYRLQVVYSSLKISTIWQEWIPSTKCMHKQQIRVDLSKRFLSGVGERIDTGNISIMCLRFQDA
jgi:hypothetical protein